MIVIKIIIEAFILLNIFLVVILMLALYKYFKQSNTGKFFPKFLNEPGFLAQAATLIIQIDLFVMGICAFAFFVRVGLLIGSLL